MAAKNKYKNQAKVSPWTLVAVGAFILAIVLGLVFTLPSSSRRIYNSYAQAQFVHQELINENKFSANDHVYRSINQRQLLRAISNGQLMIVFFSNPANANAFSAAQDINARFRGATLIDGVNPPQVIPAASLYSEGILTQIRHLEIEPTEMARLSERINERLDEDSDQFEAINVPVLAAFYGGQLIYIEFALVGEQGIRNIRDFFADVYNYVTAEDIEE